MRFIMMVIPKGATSVSKVVEYNEALRRSGVLLAFDGLFPPSTGARVSYENGKPTVTDGPFVEAKEVVGSYWIIQVRSHEEAIEWARRAPMSHDEVIDVRRIHEMPDFPEDVRQTAEGVASRSVPD